jgi:stage IV sporulation protein FB
MKDGILHLFYWRKVPVQLHWTVLAFVAYAAISRTFSGAELLGFGIVILVHELGHAFLVQRCRLRALRIMIHAFGGECIHEATHDQRQSVIIAWGGVLAQAALFLAALVFAKLIAPIHDETLRDLVGVLLGYNLIMAAFNLLPIPPFDGHMAWKLTHLRSSTKRPSATASKAKRAVRRTDIDRVVDEALDEARSKKSADT